VSLPITYQLKIEIERPVTLCIGRLGEFLFPVGRYVYTGSARRNMEARIARHLRQQKSLRWHIDWLLSADAVHVLAVVRSRTEECTINQKVRGVVLVPGFGASDCRSGCGSHLRYLGRLPS
jgi:Uri superfamily endonuclease